MTMEAVRFDPATRKLSLQKVEIPRNPLPDEVIIKVAYAGVCGTDLHIIAGRFPCSKKPFTVGHEFSGTITEVGSAVTHLKKGDRVSVDPNSSCYCCRVCTSGTYQLCQVAGMNNTYGIFRDGGFASYCKANSKQVYKLPDTINLQQGVLAEPLSCLAHGIDQLRSPAMGSKFLIIGAGIIGVLWVNSLHLLGHRRIMLSEPSEGRRKLIEGMGLGVEVVTPQQVQQLHEKDPTWGVDVVIDCSGNAKAVEAAIDYLNPGGKLFIFGISAPEAKFAVSPYAIYKKELSIHGILINPFTFPKALGYLESFGDKYLNFNKIGIQVFRLDQYEEAVKTLGSGTISKAVFKIE